MWATAEVRHETALREGVAGPEVAVTRDLTLISLSFHAGTWGPL